MIKKNDFGNLVIKIIDFGISTRLSKEETSWQSIEILEGSLPYISPEQTGRVNRSIDYRTDFYSLGITFYELLTGEPPFTNDDPVELIHSHIAKIPKNILEIRKDLPLELSLIINKLLQKNPEERYQSANGILKDLKWIMDNIVDSSIQTTTSFIPGLHDYSDVFKIPQKLYGREKEIEKLLSLFDKVAGTTIAKNNHGNSQRDNKDSSQFLLVSGYSGIGKTSFVNETHKPITEKKGYFIKGKFDQFQRNIPFYAIVMAFKGLIEHLLAEPESKLSIWRSKILKALSVNAQIVIDVIPELEYITGKQKPVSELGPIESMNRFNSTLQNFINVFTQKEHPIVLFIDDLQWADTPSLTLMKNLITEPDIQYLFIIGAYRDNEVDASHPLTFMLEEVKKMQKDIHTIHLMPLDKEHITTLVSETLHSDKLRISPLVDLLHAKTGGNPFFLSELLKQLYKDELIFFDYEKSEWKWKEEGILSYKVTDNVIDLMVKKINQLPEATRNILNFAACLGNQFGLKMLSIITGEEYDSIAKSLWPAIEEGMLIPIGEAQSLLQMLMAHTDNHHIAVDLSDIQIRFQHDRVQQAAYTFISDDKKKETHLKIGRLLLAKTEGKDVDGNTKENSELLENKIFEIINQLNHGIDLVTDNSEKLRIAQLNLYAGKKAKLSIAYDSALKYLTTGIDLLPETSWESDYELCRIMYMEKAECEYLCANFDRAEELFDLILQKAKSNLDKVPLYRMRMVLYLSQGMYTKVVKLGLECLALNNINLPTDSSGLEVARSEELHKIKNLTSNTIDPNEIVNSPIIQNREVKTYIEILTEMVSAAYGTDQDLFKLIIYKIVSFSLEFGNSELSAFGFGWLSVILGALGDHKLAFFYSQVSIRMNEKFNNTNLKCKIFHIYGSYVQLWSASLKDSIKSLQESYQSGVESGDLVYAAYAFHHIFAREIIIGTNLENLISSLNIWISFLKKVKDLYMLYLNKMFFRFVQELLGKTSTRLSIEDKQSEQYLEYSAWEKDNFFFALAHYYTYRLELLYLMEDYEEAVRIALKGRKAIQNVSGNIVEIDFALFGALAFARHLHNTSNRTEKRYFSFIKKQVSKMKIWAELNPTNFEYKFFILQAEVYRLQNETDKAGEFYDLAIQSAIKNNFISRAALANELAAKFYFQKGRLRIAKTYLQDAYELYTKWGAVAKVKQLEEKYPELLEEDLPNSFTKNITISEYTTTSFIDIQTILKSTSAISEEIRMNVLIEKGMKIIIENAGAQRGALLLNRNGKFYVEAYLNEGINIYGGMEEPILLEECSQLPGTVLNFVERTKESLVLDNASADTKYNTNAYIKENNVKSVLCAPILNKGELTGIVYLENNLSTGTFTKDRMQIVNMLSGQAAISLDNARLYETLSEQEKQYRTLLENVNAGIYRNTVGENGKFLQANPAIAEIFGYGNADEFMKLPITELYDNPEERKRFLDVMQSDGFCKNMELKLKKKDGTQFIASCSAIMMYDENGKLLWMDGIIEDITERKNAEEQRSKFVEELFELNQAYERFVPAQFLQLLSKDKITDVKLGDQIQKKMSVLFSDIRSFTALSETMAPQENFNFLNSYLKRMGPVIRDNNGFIDKYIGDAIMALFPDKTENALDAAIGIMQSIHPFCGNFTSELRKINCLVISVYFYHASA